MVTIRRGWLVAALVVGAFGLVGAACNKDGGSGAASGSSDDLTMIPVDSELVMGVNFAQVQQSALWKQFVEPKLMNPEAQGKLKEFTDKCGFDPMTALKSVSVGMKNLGGEPQGVLVIHGTDKGKVLGCMDKMKDEAAKDGDSVERDGDTVAIKTKKGETVAMTYTNDSTMVVVVGPDGTKDGLKKVTAGTSTLKASAAFTDMFSKINSNDSLWVLMNGNSKVFEKAAAMGVKPKALFGSLNVTDGLSMDFRMRLDSPDQAAQFANMGKQQAGMLKSSFDKLDITSEGNDVRVALALSSQKLHDLISKFGGMLGAMGGMGGMGGP